jgi:selenocysteine lyase/cysteine desulfurase
VNTGIGSHRDLFEVPRDVAFFNTANLSPLLRSVREAGERGIDVRAAPWKVEAIDWFTEVERLRARAARLLGASPEAIALVPSASYGLAVAARNLPLEAGRRVLVVDDEFPSDLYTWRRHAERGGGELVVVRAEEGETWTDALLGALDDRVAVVVAPNVHWTNGALVDLARLAPAVREVGAALVIDASQSLGALPFDAGDVRPDFLVAVGYKWLLGPMSVGYLYVAEQHRDGEPLEENWILRAGSDDFGALTDYTDDYLPGARRFDVGERTNFGLVPMAVAALDQLLRWDVADVAAELRRVNDQIAARTEALGLVVPPASARAPHMLGVEFPREAGERVLRELADAGVVASVRGTSLRIAPHLHIDQTDVDRLIAALEAAL